MMNTFNNKTVVITRPFERSKALSDIVEEHGGVAIVVPTLELQLVKSKELQDIVNQIDTFDWIVFTSPAGVKSFFNIYGSGMLFCKIAVIGIKTAEEVYNYNNTPDLVPGDFTAEGLLESFKHYDLKGKKIALPRTLSARKTLPEGLEEYGAEVVVAEAYTSAIPKDRTSIVELCDNIIEGNIDIITFTSPLTVKNLIKAYENEKKDKLNDLINALQKKVIVGSIGPITGRALSEYNIAAIEPKEYTVKNMMEEILQNIN